MVSRDWWREKVEMKQCLEVRECSSINLYIPSQYLTLLAVERFFEEYTRNFPKRSIA